MGAPRVDAWIANHARRGNSPAVRWMAAIAAVVVLGSTAAAQNQPPDDGRFQAEWEKRATGRSFVLHYPRKALERGTNGIAILCCIPREDRSVSCRVGREWPEDIGFGGAAIALAREFRMTQASFDAFRATPEAWMQIPIRFQLGPGGDQERLDATAEEARGLCRPGRGPIIVTP
jgi:hypothetical protein